MNRTRQLISAACAMITLGQAAWASGNLLSTSLTQTFASGGMTATIKLYSGTDASSSADDIVDITMTGADGSKYVAIGPSESQMNGKLLMCHVAADGTGSCKGLTGTGLSIAPRVGSIHAVTAAAQNPSSGVAYTITVRTTAADLGFTNADQRIIGAVGSYDIGTGFESKHSAGEASAVTLNVYAKSADSAPTKKPSLSTSTDGLLASTPAQSMAGGGMTAAFAIYRPASQPAGASDLVDITMTAAGDTYVAVGVAASGMTGRVIMCYVAAAGAGECRGWTGSDYSVSPRDTASIAVQSATRSGSGYTVTVRTTAEDLGFSNAQQRIIAAVGPYTAATRAGSMHTSYSSAKVNVFTGALQSGGQFKFIYIAIISSALALVAVMSAAAVVHARLRLHPRGQLVAQGLVMAILVACVAAIFAAGLADHKAAGNGSPVGRAFGDAAAAAFCVVLFPVPKIVNIGRLVGESYERLVPYHALLGGLCFAIGTVHGILMIIKLPSVAEVFSASTGRKSEPLWGIIAWASMAVVVLTSVVVPLRRKKYVVFRMLHMFFIPAYVFAILHYPLLGLGAALSIAIYVADFVARIVVMVLNHGTVRRGFFHKQAGVTELVVALGPMAPTPRAGSFALLSACGLNLPHPITVALWDSVAREATFFIKATGKWTTKLGEAVGDGGALPVGSSVHVIGPLGTLKVPLSRTPSILLVAGGIGVTPMLRIIQSVGELPASKRPRRVLLVWTMRDLALLGVVGKALLMALRDANYDQSAVHIFNTNPRRSSSPVDVPESGLEFQTAAVTQESSTAPMEWAQVHEGRPSLRDFVDEHFADELRDTDHGCGGGSELSVFACGPSALMESAEALADDLALPTHCETFEM